MFRNALAVLALIASAASAGAAASDDILRITIDQAQIAKLPANTSTVVIGNPGIADITTLKNGQGMVVTGKGYGRTNLIALDADGNLIDEKQIHVEPARHVLVVQRGNSRESYSCDPVCMPSAVLGDDTKVFGDVVGQVGAHDQFAGKGGGGAAVK
ncbi:MAG: pilus assembly protein N-terminal domain-containing protein [Pseudomonadota bacterium]|nr:pilus assembly protein N-terminal domain-containing protein [Pseudomonadota bacterium]